VRLPEQIGERRISPVGEKPEPPEDPKDWVVKKHLRHPIGIADTQDKHSKYLFSSVVVPWSTSHFNTLKEGTYHSRAIRVQVNV
jgi:hypothetical protein